MRKQRKKKRQESTGLALDMATTAGDVVGYLVEVLKRRGLSVGLDPAGRPVLRGPTEEKTPAILSMLSAYRAELIERLGLELSTAKLREWLWRDGHRYTEDAEAPKADHPVGATWWRYVGESGWRLIEERLHHVAWITPELLRAGDGLPEGEHLAGQVSGARRQGPEPAAVVGP